MDTESFRGNWWIDGPDNPAIPGTLSAKGGSLKLEFWMPQSKTVDEVVFSSFGKEKRERPRVIHGLNEDNKPVTLFGCGVNSEGFSAGIKRITIGALAAINGLKIGSWTEPVVRMVEFHPRFLSRWFNRKLLVAAETADGQPALTCKKFLEEICQVQDGVSVRFWDAYGWTQGEDNSAFHHNSTVCIIFEEPRSLEEVTTRWTSWLGTLLGMFMGVGTSMRQIIIGTEDFYTQGEASATRGELLQRKDEESDADENAGPKWHEILVPFQSVYSRLSEVIRDWNGVYQKLQPVIELFDVLCLRRVLYVEAEFLFLVQAFEIYHASSGKFSCFDLSKSDKKANLEAAEKLLTPELWNWAKGKLGRNNRSFAQKLHDVFHAHAYESRRLLGDDLETVAGRIAYTRNHCTHFMENVNVGRLLSEDELFPVVLGLRQLLWIVLLREIGVDGQPISTLAHHLDGVQYVGLTT